MRTTQKKIFVFQRHFYYDFVIFLTKTKEMSENKYKKTTNNPIFKIKKKIEFI